MKFVGRPLMHCATLNVIHELRAVARRSSARPNIACSSSSPYAHLDPKNLAVAVERVARVVIPATSGAARASTAAG